MRKLQADRDILYRGLNARPVIEKTSQNVILLPGANIYIPWVLATDSEVEKEGREK